MTYSVFVSSTRKDLIPHREAVSRRLREAGFQVVGMETMRARNEEPLEACLDDVAKADLFVGIYAWRYGFVPRDTTVSITERELIEAESRDKPIACFIVEDGSAWPPELREEGEGACKLADLKRRLREDMIVRTFTDPEGLAALAVEGLNQEVASQLAPGVPPDRKLLFKLLKKVERFWVRDVLNRAVLAGRRLPIVREERPEAVRRPALPPGAGDGQSREPIHLFFRRHGCSLLILGPLGVGKTVALIDLARGLGLEARRDPGAAIPVLFNLASWKGHDYSLAAWMSRELARHYKTGRKQAEDWIQQDRILPLLDGLDEMDPACRPGCVKAINSHLRDHELVTGLAVTCNRQVYDELPESLELETAVELRCLTREQVDEHLAAAGPPLAALRAAVAGDAALQDLTASPLMLTLFERTYWGRTAEDIPSGSESGLVEKVFEDYVAFVLEPERQLPWNQSPTVEAKSPSRYPPARTRRSLAWLAHGMAEHAPALFQVERLQPAWLCCRGKAFNLLSLAAYSLLSHSLGGILLALPLALALGRMRIAGAGLAVGALVGVLEIPRIQRTERPPGGPAAIMARRFARTLYLAAMVCLFLVLIGLSLPDESLRLMDLLEVAVSVALLFGMVFGSRGAMRTGSRDIRVAESLVWRVWSGRWAAFGAGGLFLACMIFWIVTLPFASRNNFGVDFWIPFATIVSLLGAALIGIFGGLGGKALEKKDWPNQGTWLALRNAGFIALIASPVSILTLWLVLAVLDRAGANLPEGTLPEFPLWAGLSLGCWFGLAYSGLDFVQHFSLRLVLRLTKLVPGRLVRFLDHAVERGLLQRPGGSYTFFHPLLLDHFAKSYRSAAP